MNVVAVDILLIEDNPGDVLLTKKAFERSRLPNRLHVVSDGEAALDFIHQRGAHENAPRPALILLDINLPKVDGHEVLREIKGTPNLRQIPIVMLTSSDAKEDVAASYEAHANSYVTKPPSLHDLTEAVRELEDYWFTLVKRPGAPYESDRLI